MKDEGHVQSLRKVMVFSNTALPEVGNAFQLNIHLNTIFKQVVINREKAATKLVLSEGSALRMLPPALTQYLVNR